MAYLDLELAISAGCAVTSTRPLQLEELERQAVLVSRSDDARSLRTGGRAHRFKALVFGHRPVSKLANERLEAIRRYAVLYRLKGAKLGQGEVAAAYATGISAAKLALVRSMVDRWRVPATKSRLATHLIQATVAVSSAAWLYSWLSEETGDGLIAIILVLVIFITIIAVASPKDSSR
ncbi:hypothetical protein [Sphingomonas sp. BK345]|uniref:hypothetical protein n=1 Tax=Sphingomonas sp. BK345 TaxID=2586980 RepID=UPI00161EA67E|nr:hypothetical protein [Sphingomonas sp. BK345]MBB3473541.1 hypothetical protein [Sphingomonas sp. BK345]